MTGRYVMATTAIHKLGDISRDEPDIAWIYGEDGDDYIGRWVAGFGYDKVRFPKVTTRDLTVEEQEFFNGRELTLNGHPAGSINLNTEGGTR